MRVKWENNPSITSSKVKVKQDDDARKKTRKIPKLQPED